MNHKNRSGKKTVIFIDSGDTIIDESTQRFAPDRRTVLSAEFIPGAEQAVRSLYESGHTLALVADGLAQSFENIYRENRLSPCFAAKIYSEKLGTSKPDPKMFRAAVLALGLSEQDYPRIVMVGNNLARDVKGANDFGITSIYLNWSCRYATVPEDESQKPDYTIRSPLELIALVEKLDRKIPPE